MKLKKRHVQLIRNSEVVGNVEHHVMDYGWWQTTHIDKSIDCIRVFENGNEIYTENTVENYSAHHIELL